MSKFHELLGKLERAQSEPENVDLFREVLGETMVFVGVTCDEIADYTEACRSSPRRWLKGVSAPSAGMRAVVAAYLIERLLSRPHCGWCDLGVDCPRHPGD